MRDNVLYYTNEEAKAKEKNKESNMKIYLINPPSQNKVEYYQQPQNPHLGLAYLGGVLESQKRNFRVIDAKLLSLQIDETIKLFRNEPPDVVGLTSVTSEIDSAHLAAAMIEKAYPACTIVIGGVHASAIPEETLRKYPAFDIVVIGEGEYTFLELVEKLEGGEDIKNVKGIAFRNGAEVQLNPPRELISNLDEIPNPAWHLFPPSPQYMIMSTRGCPYSCTFCYRLYGKKLRLRSPFKVIEEIEAIIDLAHPKSIAIVDATFGTNRKHSEELMDLIIQKGINKKINWSAHTRVDIGDYEFFAKMKEAGCNYVGFGIESGDENILETTEKNITVREIKASVEAARKAGLATVGYYILGHPNETKTMAKKTIDLSVKLKTDMVTYGIMVPWPGTEIYALAAQGKGGYRLITSNYSTYSKHFGTSLEFGNFSSTYLNMLRILGYIKFYLYNGRFLDFFKFLFQHRARAYRLVKHTCSLLKP